jgi:hypothetical protein
MTRPFIYSLRIAIVPGFREEERLGALLAFCRAARIDDVMFFFNGEELNRGHLLLEETRAAAAAVAGWKRRLAAIGVTASINPWSTLLHLDRGRTLRPGQAFTTMVDPYGRAAAAAACPLCPEWRRTIAETFAAFAAAEPWALWVEDDFRLHNHAPLDWGGCFCERHLAEYSRRAGRRLSREEFVAGVLAPGEPHPFRRIWLETSRDTWNDLARLFGEAVHAVSPATRVGLMSSDPSVHCIEGRDWGGVYSGLAGSTPPLGRPHLPAYHESSPADYLWRFAAIPRLVRFFSPARTETLPEVEDYPFGPRVSSRAFSRFKVESAIAAEADGVTLDIFSIMGNSVSPDDGMADLLAGSRPFLDALAGLGLRPEGRSGVSVLANPEAAWTLRTDEGRRMEELQPRETTWASLLAVLGVAARFGREPPDDLMAVAVSGQRFRSMDRAVIERLFAARSVLLDGEAALTLHAMGLGAVCGIRSVVRHHAAGCFATYEQACGPADRGGMGEARMSLELGDMDIYEISYDAAPTLETVMKDPEGRDKAPGITIAGGRTLVMPYGRFVGRPLSRDTAVLRDIMHAFLAAQHEARPALVRAMGDVGVFAWDLADRRVLLLVNASHDVQPVAVHPGAGPLRTAPDEIRRSEPRPRRAAVRNVDEMLRLTRPLEPLEIRALVFARQGARR